MSYQPIENNNPQPDRIHDDRSGIQFDFDNFDNPPSSTQSLKEALDYEKPFMRSKSRSTKSEGNGWPVEPQRIAIVTPWKVCLLAFDTVLASTPIMFIALALIAARLDGKDVSAYGRKLQDTLLLSPTIFPLIFAALMGRFFRHLGVYLAERGTTLGRIEQLVGCQSVFTALERQFATNTWQMVGGNESLHRFPYPFHYMSLVEPTSGTTEVYYNTSEASCNANYDYLEAKVSCNGISCQVESMRKLELLADGYTEQDDLVLRQVSMGNLLGKLPRVDSNDIGDRGISDSSNAEKWMTDPTHFIGWRNGMVPLHKLNPDVFSQRLTILWNTFHQSTFATTALGGLVPEDLSETGILTSGSVMNVTFNSTQAQVIQTAVPVYKTNWKWFVALLCSSLVLLIAAYVGLLLKYNTLAPDIIGFASSMTILNPYVPTPMGGTTLGGLERAALLHDLPVRIGDVCVDESVGAIAFAKADEGKVSRLDRRRLYV